MASYLIGEEGPLAGHIISFEQGTEWTLGRDPDLSSVVLEDPMVSRRHVTCRFTPEGYTLENLSSVNPATQNGKIIAESVLLQEGDIIQIGNTFFRFTEISPLATLKPKQPELEDLSQISISNPVQSRWLLKVVLGPNAGAEFSMEKDHSYVLGKDPSSCDVVFQDLSVSRSHAKISIDKEEKIFLEDLGSLNGTVLNGLLLGEKTELKSQDSISIGTTSFLIIDQKAPSATIVSPPVLKSPEEEKGEPELHWKEIRFSKKHLFVGAFLSLVAILSCFAILSLFQSEPIVPNDHHENSQISEIVQGYPAIQFSYNENSGKLFITGHVLTQVEKQELLYQIKNLTFLREVEDTVVIDELVWQNMNSLLVTNPAWQGVSIHSPSPGRFILKGYLQTAEEAETLSDYINMNFPYLDRLENQIVIETNLNTQINSILLENNLNGIAYELSNGELILSGRVDLKSQTNYEAILRRLKSLPGIRVLKNYAIYTSEDSSLIDLTSKYKVMGYSKKDGSSDYVVINGKILTIGDLLDDMQIVSISSTMVVLEKEGLRYKISYNLQ